MSPPSFNYDIVIVGAGIAGCAFAHALASRSEKPLKICLLERSLAEPDRIVGELLQPRGVEVLKNMGMEECLDGIDAYPKGYQGRSFHHGKFIMALRQKAQAAPGVDVLERTATKLIECPYTGRVTGVRVVNKTGDNSEEGVEELFYGDLTVVADGCFSNFRSKVMGEAAAKTELASHFVGLILENARLPYDEHGTVVLIKGHGPVLLYRISKTETRMLVAVRIPLPPDLKEYITHEVVPGLPSQLQLPALQALEKQRIRRMPNTFLPPVKQGTKHTKEGVVLIGDSWNIRHPLTGGGMTVAFADALLLSGLLGGIVNRGDDLSNWEAVSDVLHQWFWERKELAPTINVLSVALYELFGASNVSLDALKIGCFKYFERGGDCVAGPVGLLSGVSPSFFTLFRHFFTVAFYSIWILFTHPRPVPGRVDVNGKPLYAIPGVDEYPMLFIMSIQTMWTASLVFLPLMWTECSW